MLVLTHLCLLMPPQKAHTAQCTSPSTACMHGFKKVVVCTGRAILCNNVYFKLIQLYVHARTHIHLCTCACDPRLHIHVYTHTYTLGLDPSLTRSCAHTHSHIQHTCKQRSWSYTHTLTRTYMLAHTTHFKQRSWSCASHMQKVLRRSCGPCAKGLALILRRPHAKSLALISTK